MRESTVCKAGEVPTISLKIKVLSISSRRAIFSRRSLFQPACDPRSIGATNTTPATLACAFSAHQGAGGYGLLGRCLFNLDLAWPVHHYFSGVPREPGFVHRTDLLYPQR